MTLSDFVAAVVAVFRRRPGDLLPMYVLAIAITGIVRVVPFAAIAIATLYLATTGRLDTVRTAVADLEPPPTDPEAFDAWASGLEPLFDQILTPPLLALATVTVVVSIVLFALLSAAVAAGQLAACYGRLRSDRGLVAGLAGARRYWLRFLGLFVLEVGCWSLVLVVVGIGAALLAGAVSLATGSGVGPALVALFAGLLAVVLLVAVRALFAFAPVAIVVDDAGVFGAVRRAGGFVRARPVAAIFYYVVAFLAFVGLATIAGLLSLVDVVALESLLSVLVLFPVLDLLKTAVYCDYRGRLRPPDPPARSLRGQLRSGLRRGWAELTAFVRATPGIHALVVALGVLGFWIGWAGAGSVAGGFETSIAARLEGWLPPAMAVELFGNNWLVALTTAYAGIALAVPAIVSVLFNGVALGFTARLEVAPLELAAFVVPHGVIEIPAILVAGALGVSVGGTAWRTWRGHVGVPALADALERAFWVLVGVAVLLAIAAVIEGFVSPYYYRPFL
ncbi:stage II sporulation protein M [Natrinema altunense]|uniref:Stage II sporulation protein M n=1 Tax=Natrinema altunense TaxID=222984 RepID=A0A482XX49_9EURY|nr:stage II sporulation protein M [Natrinema altunense]RZH68231.1 stage II sporulation protein M [Natrinema altunense]